MGNPVVHFEIAGPDGPALRQFYSDLFGWNIEVQGEEMGNYGIVSANEGGIAGGLLPTTEDMPARSYVTFYVQVDDLQAALDKVAGMGGNAIMPPMVLAQGMVLHRYVRGPCRQHHRAVFTTAGMGQTEAPQGGRSTGRYISRLEAATP